MRRESAKGLVVLGCDGGDDVDDGDKATFALSVSAFSIVFPSQSKM